LLIDSTTTAQAKEVVGCAALGRWYAGDTGSAIALAQRALAMPPPNSASDRWARTALVDAYGYSGNVDAVVPHFMALVKSLRDSREAYWEVNGLGFEAIGLSTMGMLEDAGRRANGAIAVARQTRNRVPELGLRARSCSRPHRSAGGMRAFQATRSAGRQHRSVGIALVSGCR
jgi:hypothetical protein